MTYGPVVSLLTDFGLADAFVGVMHGVILSRAPRATVVDLTHGLPAQDVERAGYVLADTWRYFPPGTVHVAVVDPGVGSDRRILAAAVDDQCFLAPDNGLLTAVFDRQPPRAVHEVANRDLFLKSVSRTFHGRDIFAPTAGAIVAGLPLADAGREVDDWLTLDLPRPVAHPDGRVTGSVIYIDRFGNLITNIPGPQLPVLPVVEVAGRCIEGLSPSYTAADPGDLLALISSSGRLEIAVNRGRAADTLQAAVGRPVTVRPRASE